MARALAKAGAKVVIMDYEPEHAQRVTEQIKAEGGDALAVTVDCLDKEQVERALQEALDRYGRIDGLINGAGGNRKDATTNPNLSFFDFL